MAISAVAPLRVPGGSPSRRCPSFLGESSLVEIQARVRRPRRRALRRRRTSLAPRHEHGRHPGRGAVSTWDGGRRIFGSVRRHHYEQENTRVNSAAGHTVTQFNERHHYEQGNTRVNGIRNRQGNAVLSCKARGHEIAGQIQFEGGSLCATVPSLVQPPRSGPHCAPLPLPSKAAVHVCRGSGTARSISFESRSRSPSQP